MYSTFSELKFIAINSDKTTSEVSLFEVKLLQYKREPLISKHTSNQKTMVERQISSEYGTVECYVFIDDSNLWIEGQKTQGRKLKDADIDPRYRTDLGRFLNMVLTKDSMERSINKAFLYGSIPPPNDTLWNAARKKNFEVKTFKRSISGKEKKVDVAMATDITEVATEKKYSGSERQTVFVVVTGDKDLITPIELAMTKSDLISVELWAWDFSMAREFRQLANKEDKLTVRKLDNVEFFFSYKEFKSTRDNIDPTKAIVYRDVPPTKQFYYAIANDLCRLLRLFYITIIDMRGKRDLIIEFPRSRIETVLAELKRCDIGNEPCSYPEYMTTTSREAAEPITKLTNQFEALVDLDDSDDAFSEAIESSLNLDIDDLAISTADAESCSDAEDDDTWTKIARSKAGKKAWIQKRKKTECKFGIHCSAASNCPYLHSEQEKKTFHVHSHINFKFWKAKLCTSQDHFSQTSERQAQCPFAHNNADSWCLKCLMYGHFTDDCKVE